MLVCVESIISMRDYGTIFSVSSDSVEAGRFRVKATADVMLGRPAVGETWNVEGPITNTAYGPQLAAAVAYRTLPNGEGIRRFIAAHAPGIGPERAGRLWKHFGIELGEILSDDQNLVAIAAVIAPGLPNLGVRLAAATVRAWQSVSAEARLVEWLMHQGIADLGVARRISRILGTDAVTRLESNPWTLVPLMPWAKVDELGLRLLLQVGVEGHRVDRRRLVGAVDAAVKAGLELGSTSFDENWLRVKVAQLLRLSPSAAVVQRAIAAGENNGAVVRGADGQWRAPGAALMEEMVIARFKEMLAADYPTILPVSSPASISLAVDLASKDGPALHTEQRAAIFRVLQRPLSLLQGGAGVGKTFAMRVACDAFEQMGGRLVLCALAGKASLRLSRATGRPAYTLARAINELCERERIHCDLASGGANAALEKRLAQLIEIDERTLVVIDEASMVDLPTCYSLLNRMPVGSRLLMVGDDAQLPPVGFGLVYHMLVNDSELTASLTVVHRQKAETGIPLAGATLRRREIPALLPYCGKHAGVSLLETSGDGLASTVERVVRDLGGHDDGVLIVAPTNDADAGVRALNSRMHDRFRIENPRAELKGHFGNYFSVGEPVMFLRNDYGRNLFNGLLGRITAMHEDERALEVLFDGEIQSRRLGAEDFLDLALAHAITCHRAQGSQAPRIVIPLYSTRVLDPSWIYTAVTRAEHQVVFVGDVEVLKEALRRPWTTERRIVGFKWS